MTGYVREALQQFGHKTPITPQHQPYPASERTYGANAQKIKPLNTSPAISTEILKIIEHIIGKFLYYARVGDNMCSVPSITIATRNEPIEQYEKKIHQLLDYMAINPNTVVRFHASDMILHADTNASYLTELEACSRAAGNFS